MEGAISKGRLSSPFVAVSTPVGLRSPRWPCSARLHRPARACARFAERAACAQSFFHRHTRITVKDDSLPNTAIVTVEAEDHTLGNLLRMYGGLPHSSSSACVRATSR